jgi:hypothetical protein
VTAKVFSELGCWIAVSRTSWPKLWVLPIR